MNLGAGVSPNDLMTAKPNDRERYALCDLQEFPQKISVAEEHSLGVAGKAAPQRAIRAIYGSVAVGKAPHLHADPCQARVPAVDVAQVHVVTQLPLQNLDVHFSICKILRFIIVHSCHRQFFGGTSGLIPETVEKALTAHLRYFRIQ